MQDGRTKRNLPWGGIRAREQRSGAAPPGDGTTVRAPARLLLVGTALVCLLLCAGPGAIPARADPVEGPDIRLFGTVEFKRPLSSLPAWIDLLKRNQADPVFLPQKSFNSTTTWDDFRTSARGKSPLELLRHVNSFWNAWPYREDMQNWGKPDYWAIPAEFLKKSGDCEDYAIIKYFTLRELGIPPETMRIVVLRDSIRNLAHAVLVVYLNDDAYVLDNLSNAVLSHTRFRHYRPQYSVNEFGRWAHVRGRSTKGSQ